MFRAVLLFFTLLLSILLNGQSAIIRLETNYGDIKISLYDGTPIHRDNFLQLIHSGYYDSLQFHRVIKGFVIQAGDPDSKTAPDTVMLGDGDLGYSLKAEIFPETYFHKRGAVGMARDDNPEKRSSACQFYIVQGKPANDSTLFKAKQRTNGYVIPDTFKTIYRSIGGIPHLDSRYTVFGEVTDGMEVVDAIAKLPTDSNDRPLKPVIIIKTEILSSKVKLPYTDLQKMLRGIWQHDSDSSGYMVFHHNYVDNYYHMSDGENVYNRSNYFLADNCIGEKNKNLKNVTYLIQRYEKAVQCSEILNLNRDAFSYLDAVTGRIFTLHRVKKIPRK